MHKGGNYAPINFLINILGFPLASSWSADDDVLIWSTEF